jgi:hypothetical protein
VRVSDQESHEHYVADQRHQTIRRLKSHELTDACVAVVAAAPCVMHMPDEIVQQREFHGRGRGIQVVAGRPAVEESKPGKLDHRADGAYQTEPSPTTE